MRRVGGGEDRAVDVRIVAATNRDLEDQVRKRAFREDLFFRLMAATLHVPPLRERKDDLPQLVTCFLDEAGKPLAVAPETLELLGGYDWPGNVRELKNVVAERRRAGRRPHAGAPPPGGVPPAEAPSSGRPRRPRATLGTSLPMAGQTLEQLEKAAIEHALQQYEGNRTKAAKALGIASSTLYEKLKRYGLVAGKGAGEKASG